MTAQSSIRQQEWNKLIQAIANFYKRDIHVLINMLRERNTTDAEIARTLKFDPALITRYYPRVKQENQEEIK